MTEDDDIQPCPYCGAPVEQFSPGGKWHFSCNCQDPVKGVTNAIWKSNERYIHSLEVISTELQTRLKAAYRALAWWSSDDGADFTDEMREAIKAARAFVESEKETKE